MLPAWFALARDGGRPFTDADIGHIRALLSREHLLPRDRINLHFALARIHDRAGAFDEAFRTASKPTPARRGCCNYEARPTSRRPTPGSWIGSSPPSARSILPRTRSFGGPAEAPIFIVGMPRSGTSLVEQILASHPAVFGAGELRNLKQFADELPAELGGGGEYPDAWPAWTGNGAPLGEHYVERLRPWDAGSRASRTRCP